MNKAELVQQVAGRANVSKVDAGRVVNALFDTDDGVIVSALRKGEDVTITGFGKFEVRARAARTGRNPRTGKEIKIKATKSPVFRAGKGLKDAV